MGPFSWKLSSSHIPTCRCLRGKTLMIYIDVVYDSGNINIGIAGAVTHTISTSVMVFELTGQMTHIIPVIIAVLIANAISQTLELSIYDSIIQIKKLPFLPPILNTSSAAHHIYVEDIMIRDIVYIWRNCTYRDLKNVLKAHRKLQSLPLVEDGSNMILLGSVQRQELSYLASQRLSRERRLQEVRRRYSIQDTLMQAAEKVSEAAKSNSLPKETAQNSRRMSRFEVTPVPQQSIDVTNRMSPKQPVKSILKHTVSFTYSPHSTVTMTAQGIIMCT